jgi:hypothetical protein
MRKNSGRVSEKESHGRSGRYSIFLEKKSIILIELVCGISVNQNFLVSIIDIY